MTPLLSRLEAAAFHRASPAEANAAIDQVRAARALTGSEAVSYEVALPGLDADHYLLHKALPRLAYFLDCRGIHPPASGGVFVSLFCAEGLWFLEAGPLVQALAEARGLTLAEAVRRYGANGQGDPLLLGG